MRIDRVRALAAGRSVARLVALAALLPLVQSVPLGVSAQAPLFLVDRETTVRSVAFRFAEGDGSVDRERLESATALDGPGALAGLRSTLAPLPFITAPRRQTFSPLVLQKDVVRLRRLYRRSGFPDADLDYEVVLDTAENAVDVRFLIVEGPPVTLGSVTVSTTDGTRPGDWLPTPVAEAWERWDGLRSLTGPSPFGQSRAVELETRVARWFRTHGYPWVHTRIARADTTAGAVAIELSVDPGPRARVDSLRVEGNERLRRDVVLREIPVSPGDWYDERRVVDGEREVFGLELVRRALAGPVEDQPRDSTVTLQIRIDEGRPRLVWGRAGYGSEGGMIGEAHWAHRSFLGDGRSLTLSGVAETGWLAMERLPARRYGLSATLHQPYLGHRRISGSFGPFISFTDGLKEASVRYGLDATALYRRGTLESVSLQYELSTRRVEDPLLLVPLREAVEGGREPSSSFLKSAAKLTASWGKLDDPRAPSSGWLVEPSLEATVPGSEVQFVRMALRGLGAVPLSSSVSVVLQGSLGRLVPFGRSSPPLDQVPEAFVGLRDVTFTAGGTRDVRGWGAGLLGPKVPDVEQGPEGTATADGYVPVGALARATASAELILPFPVLDGPHRTFLFLDSGRVWSPGRRYDAPEPELVQDEWFHAAGGGLQFSTPVGPVRLGLGYKLDPSPVDLRPADAVLRAILEGTPISDIAPDSSRRWHVHLSFGLVP